MPEMTASELARMLEAWPEEASPWTHSEIAHYLTLFDVTFGSLGMDWAIDLACSSGSRWLGARSWDEPRKFVPVPSIRMSGPSTYMVWFTLSGIEPPTEYSDLLHAIDAAIRATAS